MMFKDIFLFATNVANEYCFSPHCEDSAILLSHEVIENSNSHPGFQVF